MEGACWQTQEVALICPWLCWQQNTWERDFQRDNLDGNPLEHSKNLAHRNVSKHTNIRPTLDHQSFETSLKLCQNLICVFILPSCDFFFFILFTRLTVASLSLTRSHTSIPHMTTFRVYPSTHPVCGSIFFSSPVISTRAGPNSLSHSFSCSYLRESTMDTAKRNLCLGAYVWLSKSCCCSVS